MDSIIELLKSLDIPQLIAMGIMIWVFYSRLDNKIDKLEQKLTSKIDSLDLKLSSRMDKIDEKLTDVDRRVCRIEGSLNSKECCMLSDSRAKQRAE